MAGTMIKSGDKLPSELRDLREEMALLSPTDTPLTSILLARGQVVPAQDINVSWREKELNTTRGTLIVEGAEAGNPIKSKREMKSNICQILEKVTSISGTSNALRPYGIGDEFQMELQDRMAELKRDLEWYFINGVKATESGPTPRQMNGLLKLIHADNQITLESEDVLTEDVLIDGMQKIWESGSHGEYFLFANATEKRIINKLLRDASTTTVEAKAGENAIGVMVQRVETDFGTINIVLDRHLPEKTIFCVDMNMVEIAELRPAFYEELAKTGDYRKGHVIVESTIKLLNSKAGFVITGVKDTPEMA